MDEELPRTGIVSPQMREDLEKREIEVGQTRHYSIHSIYMTQIIVLLVLTQQRSHEKRKLN